MSRTLHSPPTKTLPIPTDILLMTELETFVMNHTQMDSSTSLTDDLQYTIEYPSHDGSLPYMNILIHADKSTSVYRKPRNNNLYVRYNSCAPSSSKDSVIRSLTRQAHILCSPKTYKKNWTQSTQPPYKMDNPLTESNASWTVSNKN